MFWALFISMLCLLFSVRYFLQSLRIPNYKDKYVVISGCDTGFGNLLAKKLNDMGMNVIAGCLTGKGVTELREIGSERLVPIKLDITNVSDIRNAVTKVKALLPPDTGLWALVNNAGITGAYGMLDWMTKDDYLKVLEVNLFGHIEMVNHFLPLLRMSKGRIVLTSSMAGRLSGGFAIPYTASKYALEAYSDSIRIQLAASGIAVHIIEPGMHRTPMTDNNDVILSNILSTFDKASDDVKAYYGINAREVHAKRLMEEREELNKLMEGPDVVVDAMVHAVTARYAKYRYTPGYGATFILWPMTFAPEFVWDYLCGAKQNKRAALHQK